MFKILPVLTLNSHKISQQSQPLHLCRVHLLPETCHISSLCSFNLPGEVLYFHLQLSLLEFKLRYDGKGHRNTNINTWAYQSFSVSCHEVSIGVGILEGISALYSEGGREGGREGEGGRERGGGREGEREGERGRERGRERGGGREGGRAAMDTRIQLH
jgi:hypothetical protein